MDGQNPAPPKKPWNGDSPVNSNKQWFPIVSTWCRISSIHSSKTNGVSKAQHNITAATARRANSQARPSKGKLCIKQSKGQAKQPARQRQGKAEARQGQSWHCCFFCSACFDPDLRTLTCVFFCPGPTRLGLEACGASQGVQFAV